MSATTTTSYLDSARTPAFKKNMSVTQTYYLAHKARAKLSHEAARPDHDLRLLVGHANLLDGLMIELAEAEREQGSWFNQSVRSASSPRKAQEQERRVQWADRVVEEPEEMEDWDAEDADSDSSSDSEDSDSDFYDDEDVEMSGAVVSLRRLQSQHDLRVTSTVKEMAEDVEEEDDDEEDDEEDFDQLALTRSPSHSVALLSPPELVDHDTDSSSEDESMPPSPPTNVLPSFPADEKHQEISEKLYAQDFYVPPRNPTRLVSAISVY